jgi:hypothetical protein
MFVASNSLYPLFSGVCAARAILAGSGAVTGAAEREFDMRLALKTLGRVAVSLDASPLPEMMVTVGRDMVGVVEVAVG